MSFHLFSIVIIFNMLRAVRSIKFCLNNTEKLPCIAKIVEPVKLLRRNGCWPTSLFKAMDQKFLSGQTNIGNSFPKRLCGFNLDFNQIQS